MKNLLGILLVLISLAACASTGSTVGNGLTAKPVTKLEEEKNKKLSDICEKKYKGKLTEKNNSKVCVTADKKEISLTDLEKELK